MAEVALWALVAALCFEVAYLEVRVFRLEKRCQKLKNTVLKMLKEKD